MAASVHYRVQVWDMTGTGFAKGNLIAEFENAKNLGWADYLNDVPEAFFTVNQDDPKIASIRPYKDNAHVLIYRGTDLVHAGVLGEWEANADDVIFYSYGYLSLLYLVFSAWNLEYTNAQVDTIVTDALTRARTGVTSSLAEWLTAGTIQAPVTTSGGATAIVLPTYRMFYKRILFVMREMAAFARGNTTNSIVFEVTPAGVFNFWKNKGTDQDTTWAYGDGRVAGFSESSVPIYRRNDLYAVGMSPNDVLMKVQKEDASDVAAKGRRMEPLFFSWVRDSTELDRVAAYRASLGLRTDVDVSVHFYPNAIVPAGATGATYSLADRVTVTIDRGLTNVSGLFQVIGQQVFWIRGQERVRVMITERAGA